MSTNADRCAHCGAMRSEHQPSSIDGAGALICPSAVFATVRTPRQPTADEQAIADLITGAPTPRLRRVQTSQDDSCGCCFLSYDDGSTEQHRCPEHARQAGE